MLVAVTGGAGFVGSHIIKQLIEANISVRALENRSSIEAHPQVSIVKGSLTDEAALQELVKGADAIIHCAGLVAAKNTADFKRINADATKQLAEIAQKAGVKRFLLISSLAAREPQLSPYAESKLEAEKAIASVEGLQWDALRPPAIYGPGDMHMLDLFKLMKYRLAISPPDQTARLSLIYVEDLASAAVSWVKQNKTTQQPYEVEDGTPNGYSWKELLQTAATTMNTNPIHINMPRFLLVLNGHISASTAKLLGKTPFITPGKMREACHPNWVASSHSFTQYTGWKPSTAVDKGFKATVEWYRARNNL